MTPETPFEGPRALTPPVILVGMHRSGTSLLARMLDDLGLFMGWRLGPDHEATYFNKLNEWLLSAAGGRWDTPEVVRYLRQDPKGLEYARRHLCDRLSAPPAVEFLGPGSYLRRRSVFRLDTPWGFKDPRTTVTLDLWRRIFPAAKIIHLVRHGVDVASSLVNRQTQGQELGYSNFARHRRLFSWTGKRGWFGDAPRVGELKDAFSLWEAYLQYGQAGLKGLDDDQLLELRYEDLLIDPVPHMQRIAAFCGLDVAAGQIETSVAGIRADRAYSFRRQQSLLEFWQEIRQTPWMRRFDYHHLPDTAPGDG